ncbi:hypothetical protein T10_6310 [Trichinella papuae]|uniref:Uncharacterized protein n=1 Tax=Trichinella papuae TaxID=268474 RepID=A0A0V1M0N1_9BILA|nr:hypothetical protein T10_6310 [Trichinella papuae]
MYCDVRVGINDPRFANGQRRRPVVHIALVDDLLICVLIQIEDTVGFIADCYPEL